MRALSFGGGVNSTALLLRLLREGEPPDRVVFADTGEEEPRTIAYIEQRVRPFCAERGVPFDVVTAGKGRMVDYYAARRVVPSVMRRDCTSKFKVDPIKRHLKALRAPGEEVVMLVGIAHDEAHRMRPADAAWLRHDYPLVRWRMGRADCEAEIARAGWPSPGKSGCRGCPFAGRRGLLRLLQEDPQEFARWRAMEEGGSRYPDITLVPGVRLGWLERGEREQARLDAFEGGECMAGACILDPEEPTGEERAGP